MANAQKAVLFINTTIPGGEFYSLFISIVSEMFRSGIAQMHWIVQPEYSSR